MFFELATKRQVRDAAVEDMRMLECVHIAAAAVMSKEAGVQYDRAMEARRKIADMGKPKKIAPTELVTRLRGAGVKKTK